MSPKVWGRGTPVHGKLSLAKSAAGMRQRVSIPGEGTVLAPAPWKQPHRCPGQHTRISAVPMPGMLRQCEAPHATMPLQIAW